MARRYYKEPDVEYGRPKTRIAIPPRDYFRAYDEKMKGWDARRFRRELAIQQGRHEWAQQQAEWVLPRYKLVKEGNKWWFEQDGVEPMFSPDATPITDPDEGNRFLDRPPAVSRITSQERAAHALALGMILIAVDPHTPDLEARLNTEAKNIRADFPQPIKTRGRPSASTDIAGIDENKLKQWREHRVVFLHHLRLNGHDPGKARKQLAAWMFPEIKDPRKRGLKLDRAVELLDEALAAARMIDVQTRTR
jgi:hypothetical protein